MRPIKFSVAIFASAALFTLQAPARAWTANDVTFTNVEEVTENSEATAGGWFYPLFPGQPKNQGFLSASASPSVYNKTSGSVVKILKRTYTKQPGDGSLTLSIGVWVMSNITISGAGSAFGGAYMSRSGTPPDVSGTWDHEASVSTNPPGSNSLSFNFNRNVLNTSTEEFAMAASARASKGTPGGPPGSAYGYGLATVTIPSPP